MPAHCGVTSPNRNEWMRPKDVLLKLKAKKKALKARLDKNARQQQLHCTNTPKSTRISSQTKLNPFRCLDGKDSVLSSRSAVSDSFSNDQSVDNTLFEILRSGVGDVCAVPAPISNNNTAERTRPGNVPAEPLVTSFTLALRRNCRVGAPHTNISPQSKSSPNASAVTSIDSPQSASNCARAEFRLGVDWQLYSHVRILSKTAFPWSQHLKTVEEASAVTAAVRCLTDSTAPDSSPACRLHRLGFYWQHPWLPWLTLWPRRHTPPPGGAARSVFTDSSLQRALVSDWCESLRSLFQLVRSRQCAYFYVCCARFTCVFRAAGVGGWCETHALIAPTTHGLRQLLKRDDIEFSMPLRSPATAGECSPVLQSAGDTSCVDANISVLSQSSTTIPATFPHNSTDASPSGASFSEAPVDCASAGDEAAAALDGSENDDDDDDDDGAKRWLESMGIETKSMPGISSTRRKLQHEMRANASSDAAVGSSVSGAIGEDSSLVVVHGGSIHALLNFLLNARACVSPTGPLAGVPPTLLSPVAFHGGSLQPLKRRQSVVQRAGESLHSLELSGGAILPHTLHSLLSLLSDTVSSFSVHLTSPSSSSPDVDECPFNRVPAPKMSTNDAGVGVFGAHNLSDCGISDEWVQAATNPCRDTDHVTGRRQPRHFSCHNGVFTR